mgnify:CR=1 FL=1
MPAFFHATRAASVIDQYVYRSGELFRRLYQLLHLVIVCKITQHNMSTSAQGNDLIGHFFCLRFVATMDDDDGFLKGEFPGDCFANPSAAAGDQRLLTAQTQVHVPVPFYNTVNFVR